MCQVSVLGLQRRQVRFLLEVQSLHWLQLKPLAQVQVQDKAYNNMLEDLLDHTVPEILPHQVHSDLIFLDARERNEYEVSAIAKSTWVGYTDFDIQRLGGANKKDSIIVYCSVGYRSEKIAEQLIEAGYENVFNLYGGLFQSCN